MENEHIFSDFFELLKKDRKLIYYLIYYSLVEGILIVSIPLSLDFSINSIIAHSTFSIIVVGIIIISIFVFITLARVLQEYILEKFQQKIFAETGLYTFDKAYGIKQIKDKLKEKEPVEKIMNYFFDVTTIQKFFPVVILGGITLLVNVIVGFLLLLAFNIALFELAIIIFIIYTIILIILSHNGIKYAKYRSNMKHEAFFFLQNIVSPEKDKREKEKEFIKILMEYINARQKLFGVMIRQKTLTFFVQGVIYALFFILGGFLVVDGKIPVGEFVAAEIIIVFINSALNNFVKYINYFYELIEGVYKVGLLKRYLGNEHNE